MTVQVPLKQREKPRITKSFGGFGFAGSSPASEGFGGGYGGGYGGGFGGSFGGGFGGTSSLDMFGGFALPASSNAPSNSSARYAVARARCAKPKIGTANAARVSKGTKHGLWGGLGVSAPQRHPSEHITVTIVIYNTISGGVPSETDVIAAIDDMEKLYTACGQGKSGRLADAGFDFMKKE